MLDPMDLASLVTDPARMGLVAAIPAAMMLNWMIGYLPKVLDGQFHDEPGLDETDPEPAQDPRQLDLPLYPIARRWQPQLLTYIPLIGPLLALLFCRKGASEGLSTGAPLHLRRLLIDWGCLGSAYLMACLTGSIAIHSHTLPLLLLMVWGLISLAAIDYESLYLPDAMTLSLLWLGLLSAAAGYGLVTPVEAIIGAAFGYFSLFMLDLLFRAARGYDGMANGDFKMLAMIGAWLGPVMLPTVVFSACVISALVLLAGRVVDAREILGHESGVQANYIPFGVGLAGGGLLTLGLVLMEGGRTSFGW